LQSFENNPPAAGVVYLRGRQKSAMLDSAATRRNRVATPASPQPPAGLDLFFRKEII